MGINIFAGTPIIRHVDILGYGSGIYTSSSSQIQVDNCNIVNTNNGHGVCIATSSAKMNLTNSTIRAIGGSTNYGIGDWGNGSKISNCHIEGGILINNTLSKYCNCYIEALYLNRHAVYVSTGDDLGLHLINCTLKADGTGKSVYSSSAKSVRMCNCTVNTDVGANITVEPGEVYLTTNVKNTNI